MKPYSFIIRSHSEPVGSAPFSIWFPSESGPVKSYISEDDLRSDLLYCGFPYEGIALVFKKLMEKGSVENHESLTLSAFARLTSSK